MKSAIAALVKKYGVSSGFGERIINGKKQFHNGIDIATPAGTEIKIEMEGLENLQVWWDNQYGGGLSCVAFYKNKLKLGFAHLSGVLWKNGVVSVRTGNTGISTGPHLHLTVTIDGKITDPLKWLSDNE